MADRVPLLPTTTQASEEEESPQTPPAGASPRNIVTTTTPTTPKLLVTSPRVEENDNKNVEQDSSATKQQWDDTANSQQQQQQHAIRPWPVPSPNRTFRDKKSWWLNFLVWSKHIMTAVSQFGSISKVPFWKDPTNISSNVGQNHTPLRLYKDLKQALNCGLLSGHPAASCPNRVCLLDSTSEISTWRFHLYDNPGEVPNLASLSSPSFPDANSWGESTVVPSQWQLANPSWGDPPIYSNFTYQNPGRLTNLSTFVSSQDNPTGVYRCTFSLPSSFSDGEDCATFLILHGVGSCALVYMNGRLVGHCTNSMSESEFDISQHLDTSNNNNMLTIMVPRYSSMSYLEDQDMWRLSGIHRSVEIQRRPRALHMWDYEVIASFDRGIVEITAEFLAAKGALPGLLRATLYDTMSNSTTTTDDDDDNDDNPNPTTVIDTLTVPIDSAVPPIPSTRHVQGTPAGYIRHVITIKLFVTATLQESGQRLLSWSAEFPNLYPLTLEVIPAGASAPIQVEICRVGFRDVTWSATSGQLLINHHPITICGVNRHEFSDSTGKVISEASMLEDVILMKRNNFNAVRCSHYPNHHRWYELCDHYGLWVCDEANVETHGFMLGGALSLLQFDSKFKSSILSRTRSMVLRSRNHPCIFMWSLGNESGFGPNMLASARLIRALDDSRPIHYEGGMRDGTPPMFLGDGHDPISNVICPMYHTPNQIVTYGKNEMDRRPVILCEYSHAMGNSSGGLHLYWNLFRSPRPEHERLQGGFIWDWVDQGLLPLSSSTANATNNETNNMIRGASPTRATARKSALNIQFGQRSIWKYGGDFGENSGMKDAQFCCNGLVFPDRTPHPALFEAKYLMQPFLFSLEDVVERVIVIGCKCFQSWTLETMRRDVNFFFDATNGSDGSLVCEAREFHLQMVDHVTFNATLALEASNTTTTNVFVRVWAALSNATSYAPAGHVLAHDSFEVETFGAGFRRIVMDPRKLLPFHRGNGGGGITDTSRASLVAVADGYIAKTRKYTARIEDKTCGLFSLKCNDDGIEMLRAPIQHSFYRAPTDNDLGGAETHVSNPFIRHFIPESTRSHANTWRRAGLNALRCVVTHMEMDHTIDPAPMLFCRCTFMGARDVPLFEVETSYTFLHDVISIRVFVQCLPGMYKARIKSLPRVGLCMELAETMGVIAYAGRGPHENYPDRRESAKMGVFDTVIDAMHVPYIFPTENGGRTDCRWVCCRSHGGEDNNTGLLLMYSCEDAPSKSEVVFASGEPEVSTSFSRPVGMRGAQLSLSRFSITELEDAKHQNDLSHSMVELVTKSIKVHIDTAFMGVGGDVSWFPSTHACYFVDPLAGGVLSSWSYQVDVRVLGNKEMFPVPNAVGGRRPGGNKQGWRV